MSKVEPSYTPGEILSDELQARGWSTARFAEILGRSVEATSALLNNQIEITRDVAADIGRAFGTGPELWLNLQENYQRRYPDLGECQLPA